MSKVKATDVSVAKKFLQIHTRANKKSLEFNMTLARVRVLMNTSRCFFTNKPISFSVPQNDPMKLSFDRIDNSKGYTDENVVACTQEFNLMKGNISILDIERLYKGIKKHQNK